MNVSDEAKLFAVRKKLLEAERTIYEANKIIAYIGTGDDTPVETCSIPVRAVADSTGYVVEDPALCVE